MKVVAKQAANLDALDRAAIMACLSNAASEVHKRFTGHIAFIYSKQAWDLWTTSNK
jgi:hypothetical protein